MLLSFIALVYRVSDAPGIFSSYLLSDLTPIFFLHVDIDDDLLRFYLEQYLLVRMRKKNGR